MLLKYLENDLNKELKLNEFMFDRSLNGIQVDASKDKEVKKIAVAVDACYQSIEKACEINADLLIVHHGLFWGTPLAIAGPHYNRVKKLLDNDIALYAAHIPLDAHPVLGNNAQMCKKLGLINIEPFSKYKGVYCGFKGEFTVAVTADDICNTLGFSKADGLLRLDFGKKEIKTIGIVSGAAGEDAALAAEEGLDAFITGEIPHQVYHQALEDNINVIAGGHYMSETFGVLAVGQMLKDKYDIDFEFIDIRTGT